MSVGRCNIHCLQGDIGDELHLFKNYSNHLENWIEWREKRMNLFHKLYKTTGRKPGELILNYGEEFRKVQEERTRMEYTRINTDFDKYRGNPEYWLMPSKLKDKGFGEQQYFAFKTLAERNIMPSMTHIATPQFIMKEKEIFPLVRSIYSKWSSSKYRQQQMKILSNKLKQVEPHIPDPSSLFVTGERLVEKSVKNVLNETFQSSTTSLDRIPNSCFELNKISRMSLNINEKNVISTDDVTITCPKIKYFFRHSDLKTPMKERLTMTNNGMSTVRIIWRKMEKFSMFQDEMNMKNIQDSCFYFGKQEILLRPGKTEEIPLWFLPKRHGVYSEKWSLQTIPKISDEKFDMIIIFQSVTEDDQLRKASKRIKETIENGVRNTMIKECLSDLLNEFRYTETSPKICHISQQQLFECKNLKKLFGLRKPAYTFKEKNIRILRTFYSEIKQLNDPEIEDLSIEDLKLVARKADIINYTKKQDRISARIDFIRNELNKNPGNKVCMNTDVIWGSNLSLCTEKLKDILIHFETPLMIPNKDREKHVIAFNVLRNYLIRMCNALQRNDGFVVKDNCIPCIDPEILKRRPLLRWGEERFDDIWIPKSKFIPPVFQNIPMNPKPPHLERISPENVQGLYLAYFTSRTNKRLPRENKLSSVSASTEQTDNNNLYLRSLLEMPTCSFDDIVKTKSKQLYGSFSSVSPNYDRYILIYTTLQEAIDAIVDAIETFKVNYVEDHILEEVLESGRNEHFKKDKIVSKSDIEEESSKSYADYLLDLILLKNENVTKYIVGGLLPEWDQESLNAKNGVKLGKVASRRILLSQDKYLDLLRSTDE